MRLRCSDEDGRLEAPGGGGRGSCLSRGKRSVPRRAAASGCTNVKDRENTHRGERGTSGRERGACLVKRVHAHWGVANDDKIRGQRQGDRAKVGR